MYFTDIQEYYEVTLLDDTKSTQQKTSETLHVAAKWDKQPLLPPQSNNDVSLIYAFFQPYV